MKLQKIMNCKGFEGVHEVTEVLSWNLPRGTEESHLRLSRKLGVGTEEIYEKS
jgi:hypothetical protein